MGLDAWELAGCLAIVVVGAYLQGTVGFGLNLVIAPVIALIAPAAIPGSVVLLSLPMTLTMVAREHEHVDRPGVLWFSLGRIPGTALGVLFVALVADDVLQVAVGALIVVAVAVSLFHPKVRVETRTSLAAGMASGVSGTVAAIDGPPLALLYQRHPGHVIRPTLAVCFVVGTFMSAGALLVAGKIRSDQLVLTLELVPALLVGLGLSTVTARRLHGRSLRPAVLTIAAVAGAAAVLRGLL
jgi:uncharacterized membrane protein YfcA